MSQSFPPLKSAPNITVTTELANKNVIASPSGIRKRGVTIVKGTARVVPGQVLGRVTATGKHAIYNIANSDGTEVATCIALNFVESDANFDQVTEVAVAGELYLDQLVGWTAAAASDLGATEDVAFNLMKF